MEKSTEQMEEEIKTALVVMKEEGALTVIDQSKALVVTNIQTKARSMELQNEAKAQRKRYADLVEPFKKALKARHTNACAKESELLTPFDEVIGAESIKVATFNEQERVRLAKEAAERAEIEAAERAERVTAAQKAVDEAIGTTEASQETIDILTLMLDEDEMTDEQAEVIRAKITTEQAVLDGANRAAAEEASRAEMEASAPPPPPPMAAPKVAGEVTGYAYTTTVTDMKALCKAIGEGTIATAAVTPAKGKLNSYAKDGIITDGQYGCNVTKKPTSFTRP